MTVKFPAATVATPFPAEPSAGKGCTRGRWAQPRGAPAPLSLCCYASCREGAGELRAPIQPAPLRFLQRFENLLQFQSELRFHCDQQLRDS